MTMSRAVADMRSLVSEWLGIAGAAVFVVIAASHLRHLTTATGQRRPWHACHVLIAVGMAFMYAPAAIDPFVIPAGFWRVVFALACVLAGVVVDGRRPTGPDADVAADRRRPRRDGLHVDDEPVGVAVLGAGRLPRRAGVAVGRWTPTGAWTGARR